MANSASHNGPADMLSVRTQFPVSKYIYFSQVILNELQQALQSLLQSGI